MKKRRFIPRFDVKGPNVVKGIQLEGLRVVGKPAEFARKYYEQGADEIIYIDIVASLYERNNLLDVIKEAASLGICIPMTVGGGIRKLEDITQILRAGADKVAINTAATRNPDFIKQAVKMFGSQCIVGSIHAKKQPEGNWEAYVDNGREVTGLNVIEWAQQLAELGVGELLVTSVDKDGTKKGFDTELIAKITKLVSIPVIACGGAKTPQDVADCFTQTNCDAISFATMLHYDTTTIQEVKETCANQNILVRQTKAPKEIIVEEQHKIDFSVIDYGLGNLRSVFNAFESLGHNVKAISQPNEILESEFLILPGVGAFGDGMKGLNDRGLIDPIREFTDAGNPILGICLGMQLLMSESEEFGSHKGLNLIEGRVISFDSQDVVNEDNYLVPHVGWNNLVIPDGHLWNNSLLEDIPEHSDAYFVHSFKVIPDDPQWSLANAIYGKQIFCAAIKKNNILGTQFHPEKSGCLGMQMIEKLCQLHIKENDYVSTT